MFFALTCMAILEPGQKKRAVRDGTGLPCEITTIQAQELYVLGNDVGFAILAGQHLVGLAVAFKLLFCAVEAEVAAQTIGDIAQVWQDRGHIADLDVTGLIRLFAAAQGLDEVNHVSVTTAAGQVHGIGYHILGC